MHFPGRCCVYSPYTCWMATPLEHANYRCQIKQTLMCSGKYSTDTIQLDLIIFSISHLMSHSRPYDMRHDVIFTFILFLSVLYFSFLPFSPLFPHLLFSCHIIFTTIPSFSLPSTFPVHARQRGKLNFVCIIALGFNLTTISMTPV